MLMKKILMIVALMLMAWSGLAENVSSQKTDISLMEVADAVIHRGEKFVVMED